MKIGIVTEYYYPHLGGISENVHNTRTRLEKLDHEVRVITSSHGGPRPGPGTDRASAIGSAEAFPSTRTARSRT